MVSASSSGSPGEESVLSNGAVGFKVTAVDADVSGIAVWLAHEYRTMKNRAKCSLSKLISLSLKLFYF